MLVYMPAHAYIVQENQHFLLVAKKLLERSIF